MDESGCCCERILSVEFCAAVEIRPVEVVHFALNTCVILHKSIDTIYHIDGSTNGLISVAVVVSVVLKRFAVPTAR